MQPEPYTRLQKTPEQHLAPRVAIPTQVIPVAEQHLAPAPPPGMRVIGYVRIGEVLHPQYGPLYEAPAPLPPPQTGLDVQAQRTAARGVLALGVGVGSYFGMQAVQLVLAELVQFLIAAAVVGAVWVTPGGRRGGGQGATYNTYNRGMLAGMFSRTGPRK